MQGNVLWPGLFVVQTQIGCGSGGRVVGGRVVGDLKSKRWVCGFKF